MREQENASQGLSSAQAKKRLFEYGENRLASSKKISAGKIFASQFKDFLVLILLASTVISVLMGEITEALTIIAIVFLNAVLGFFQEYRTEKTLDALKNMSAPSAKVIRDGKEVSIPASEVVPGDLVVLETGDRVPADARVAQCVSLHTDESMLSGESNAVEKVVASEDTTRVEINRPDLVYMGTTVTQGRGKAVVLKTGMNTQMGQIAGMLTEIEEEPTPLQKKLDSLGKWIAIGCLVICGIVTLTGILRGEPVFDMFLTGLSLSVAAVPEGLPAIVTIALGLAVTRMLKRQALIRKLHAVETLGCADVICSDKTGTLTENKMTVRQIYLAGSTYSVTGGPQEKYGEIKEGERSVTVRRESKFQRFLEVCVLCNNADITPAGASSGIFGAQDKGEMRVAGEATESALLVLGAKCGVLPKDLETQYTRLSEIPFDSSRKLMSVVVSSRSGERLLLTKGAPEILLERCDYYRDETGIHPMTPGKRREILAVNEEMAKQAMRVLCCADRQLRDGAHAQEQGLVFDGLVGMIDPPRREAFHAVAKCRRAGIRPVMITGDHKVTAAAIARELKILREGDLVLSGAEIDAMGEEEFARVLPKTAVFARVTPAHKLKIVRTLKQQGHVVAMTGDGVNDAPAIKEADIGVAMGENGTDVTKEAADVVLLDDNFATLVSAVEEGRVIYRNIRKFIRYLLSCNVGEVATMFLGMLMGMPVVLLPIQILLVNLVTDSLPAIALGLEPADEDVMSVRPRRKEEGVFSGGLLSTILFRGALIGLTTLAVFVALLRQGGDLTLARTGALAALVFTQLIHVFECKSETKSLFGINPLNNLKLIGAVGISTAVLLASIYHPFLSGIFCTVPLSLGQMILVLGMCMAAPVLNVLVLHGLRRKPKLTDLNTPTVS